MKSFVPQEQRIVIAATNIQGLGATQLLRSLLPAIARVGARRILRVWLPDCGPAADLSFGDTGHAIARRAYARRLPNAASRVLECMTASGRIAGECDLLVLGDLPYRTKGRQVVFVQTPFLLAGSWSGSRVTNIKSAISRWLFRTNLRFVDRVIVQTPVMANGLLSSYPELEGRISIIGQPAPEWLLSVPKQIARRDAGQALRLFFPASPYPHKNHVLLARALEHAPPVARVELTIDADALPAPHDPRLGFNGMLGTAEIIARYQACDGLVFPSLEESYGLPLVEAMFLGLPILAADLPYAHALCGNGAIYFDPHDSVSLASAILELRHRLDVGWRPDWLRQLAAIPSSWDDVARRMMDAFDE